MKRIFYYMLLKLAFFARMISNNLYMKVIVTAFKCIGVNFVGKPEYIHYDAFLDASGGLTIEKDVVISTKVIILSHDWSFLKREKFKNIDKSEYPFYAFKPVTIGENSFIGAGAIILPGTVIGENCIVGAGAVVKGKVEANSIVAGNPAKVINKV